MTHHDSLDRDLVTWFSDDAARRMPAGLLAAIESKSRGRRQQPAWLVALRGESIGVGLLSSTRVRRLALLVALAVLVAMLAIAIAGQQQRTHGLLAFVRHGDVYLAEPDGTNGRVALHQAGSAFSTVAWSPTDARLAIDGDSGVVVLDSATGKATFVGGSNPVWSPNGQELAVLVPQPGGGAQELRIVDAASLSTRALYPFAANAGLAWSPNGRWIAATGGDGSKSVVRIDVVSGQVIQIEGPSGHLDAPKEISWSPDSLRVAFVRYENPRGPLCGDLQLCRVDVVVANADGSHAVQVNSVPGRADMPSWSPDGKWLAFRATDVAENRQNVTGHGIHLVRADGTGERTLVVAPVSSLAWNRDSTRLMFTVGSGASAAEIWETSLTGDARSLDMSIDEQFAGLGTGLGFALQPAAVGGALPPIPTSMLATTAPRLVAATPREAAPADPIGIWQTLVGQSDDGCSVKTITIATGLATTAADLCNPPASQSSTGSVSPTGEAYALIRDGRLTVIGTNGQAGVDVPELTGLTSVAWSPDAKWLAATGAGSYLLRPDGSSRHGVPGIPSWSPDGRTIAIATTDGSLLIGQSDGTELRSIGAFSAPVAWAPDGSRFGFILVGDLWTAASDGRDARNVTSFPLGGVVGVAWSPDGAWIAVTAAHGLWLMAPDGTQRRLMDLGLSEYVSEVIWSPDSHRLAVQAYDDGAGGGQAQSIYLVNADGSSTIRVDGAMSPSWSPDGAFLVATNVPGYSGSGPLSVMNADGSGRHDLSATGVIGALVWLR